MTLHRPVGFLLLAPLLLAAPAAAEDGRLDPTFGQNGLARYGFDLIPNGADLALAVATLPEGGVVVAGSTAVSSQGNSDLAIMKLLPNGALDPGFGSGGKTRIAFDLPGGSLVDVALGLALSATGQIVLAGYVEGPGGNLDVALARLQPNGTPDPAFDGDGRRVVAFNFAGSQGEVGIDVVVQPDGKIVVAGAVEVPGPGTGSSFNSFALRLLASGANDPSFGNAGRVVIQAGVADRQNDFASALLLQPDHKLVLAGLSQSGPGLNNDLYFARLHPGGTLDTGFGANGGTFVPVEIDLLAAVTGWVGLGLQPDGGLVAAFASPLPPNGATTDLALVRLSPQGAILATEFLDVGNNSIDVPTDLVVQSDGRVVVTGFYDNGNGTATIFAARFERNGETDLSFGIAGRLTYPLAGFGDQLATASALVADGKVVLAGAVEEGGNAQFAILRLDFDLVFADGFEAGLGRWGGAAP